MSKKDKYILAIDTGLTNSKALIFSQDGCVLAEVQRTTPVRTEGNGHSEIDMEELWSVIREIISEVTKSVPDKKNIVCIGFSGHGNGLYCLDANGNPLRKAITSMDTRAISEVTSFPTDLAEILRKKSMQQLWSGQPGMILRHLKKHDPKHYGMISRIMLCKDYLAYRLTNIITTDYSDISASGLMNNSTGVYDMDILSILEIPEVFTMLPEYIHGYDIRGGVSLQGARDTGLHQGTPVIGGMFDVDSCTYGCGTVWPGSECSIAGTWNINARVSERMTYSDRIRQCIWRTDGQTTLMIDSSATSAVNIKWYIKKLLAAESSNYSKFDQSVAGHQFRFDSPYFLPFVNGSLGSYKSRAAFIGIDILCDNYSLFAAVYEGICFAHRWHLENIGGDSYKNLRVTGGTAKGKQFCQLFADVCGKRIETVNVEQSGAFGIWAAATCAIGLYNNMETALSSKLVMNGEFIPDKNKHELFNNRYQRFKELIQCHL